MNTPKDTSLKIVAELAQGFEGKAEQALIMIRAAAAARADAVKFQLVYADELATPEYKYYGLFKNLEMPDATWKSLADYSAELGIELQVDIFGRRSLELAEKLAIKTIKLHGTDTANPALLRDVAASNIECVMLGAGGGRRGEIEDALKILNGKQVILMLGFQAYPTPTDANQISRVAEMARRFAGNADVSIGFADHADPEDPLRMALAAAAVGAGAGVIEKHLTLGRNMEIEDFESALNPDQFGEFATTLRGVASAVGTTTEANDFGMSEAEISYRNMIRRHVVTAHKLEAGTVLAASDLVLKRADIDDPITEIELAVGRTLKVGVAANAPIRPVDLGD